MSRELQLPSPYIELLGPNPTLPVGLTIVTIPYGITSRPFIGELVASMQIQSALGGSLLYDKLPSLNVDFRVNSDTRALFFDITHRSLSAIPNIHLHCRQLRDLASRHTLPVVLVVQVSGYSNDNPEQLFADYTTPRMVQEADLELYVLACESKNHQTLWKVTRGKHRAVKTITPIPVIEIPEIDRH